MIAEDTRVNDLELKLQLFNEIKTQIDKFELNTLKNLVLNLIINDDVDTLNTYLTHLKSI